MFARDGIFICVFWHIHPRKNYRTTPSAAFLACSLWAAQPGTGVPDLGGCGGGDGEIEAARLIVCEREMTLISADRRTLVELGALLEQSLGWAISARPETLAA